MNILEGKIVKIQTKDDISLVFVDVKGSIFSSLLLDTKAMGLEVGDKVDLLFKETEVLISSPSSQVSARNAFISKVISIEKGEILSQIDFSFIDGIISSIITTNALNALDIKEQEEFLWFVKANEVSVRA
ncbi:MAG: TOBE domain-containing protein [Arcobacteraceae bacterium]